MKKIFNLIKVIYFIFTISIIFTCQVLRTYKYIEMYDCSIMIFVIGIIGLLIYIFDKLLNIKKIDKYDILLFLLIIFGIISTIFAINKEVSIFGFQNRNEGLLVIITYYFLFLVAKSIENKKYKNIILNTILLYGLLHCIYAICQYFNLKHLLNIPIIRRRYYSTGLENNPNFFGSITIVCLSISLSTFLTNKEKSNIVYGLLSTIYFMGLITSGTMSSTLTLIIILPILLIIIFIDKPKIGNISIKLLYLIITFLICFYLFNIIDRNYYFKQINITKNEIINVTKGNIQDRYGTGRIHIWKNSLNLASKNLITGVGIDNFFYGFDKTNKLIDIKSHLYVDKAHNEYLQKLVTEGIFSLITYLTLLFTIFISSFKKIIKNKEPLLISLFISFVAYAIQAFFNISVICVAPMFYIIMGLLVSEVNNEKN